MVKYNIEGNIDFYGELYKMMDDNKEDENDNLDNKDNKFCLISNTPLVEHFVTLTCSHKFNYIPLYKDILNHRKKYHNMERHSLRPHELRCPYCRSVQKGLLPYIPELGLDKEHGVNFIDTSIQIAVPSSQLLKSVNGKCHFGLCDSLQSQSQSQSQNMVIDASQNVVIDHLGMMNESLPVIDNSYNVIPICKNTQVVILDLDKKTYCYQHLYIAKKNYLAKAKLELKQKMKYIQNLKKESLKKEKLEAKKQEKEKEKQAKLQQKQDKTQKQCKTQEQLKTKSAATVNVNVNENVVITQSSNSNVCIQILKTGKNKGIQCGCLVTKDNLCTRHYNLLNKNNNIAEK